MCSRSYLGTSPVSAVRQLAISALSFRRIGAQLAAVHYSSKVHSTVLWEIQDQTFLGLDRKLLEYVSLLLL